MLCKTRVWVSTLTVVASMTALVMAEDKKPAPAVKPQVDPVEYYRPDESHGWELKVHRDLYTDQHAELRTNTLRLLGDHLYRIERAVPTASLPALKKVPIWIELKHPRHPCMCYHTSADWLRENDMNPAKAKGVELANCENFLQWTHAQPWMVLHELAHAYHDRELKFEHPEIKAAHQKAVAAGIYDQVLHINGRTQKHYAATNPQEYFAEASEAYFGTNDFFPFVRPELKRHDPAIYEVLEKVWRVK